MHDLERPAVVGQPVRGVETAARLGDDVRGEAVAEALIAADGATDQARGVLALERAPSP
jgi:hypothetical protein